MYWPGTYILKRKGRGKGIGVFPTTSLFTSKNNTFLQSCKNRERRGVKNNGNPQSFP
jgi:hypothetical protein